MIRLTCFILYISSISANIIIETTSGDVRGRLVYDKTIGVSYYAYYGIPYAEPPTGERRFMPPVPKRPWNGVFDATKPGPVCPQREVLYTRDQMSEDCLGYNVYVPANITNKLLPVEFHIHGGNFDFQSGNPEPIYGPQLFVRNYVLVTLNYRLGALGYLSLCNEEISGNAGIKDVILALKTVYKNIRKFGGDPNKITVFGNAAGAVVAELLMLTDETEGLFSGVYLQSGSVLSTKYLQLYPRQNAMALARELGIKYRNEADLIEQFKCADVFDIVDATQAVNKKDPLRGYRYNNFFTPTVEKDYNCAVITEPPLDLLKKGAIRDVPIVFGVNNREGVVVFPLLRDDPDLIDKFNNDPELLVPEDIRYPKGSEARRNLAARIKKFYFNNYNISIATVQNYVNLMTDTEFLYPIDKFVELFSEKKKSNVYYNLCAVNTELNYYKAVTNITYPGCVHADEIGYEFITAVTKPKYKNLSPVAERLQDLIFKSVRLFTNTRVPSDIPGLWPPAGPDRYHLEIYNYAAVTVYNPPFPERVAFWRSVYEEYFNSRYNTGSYFCLNENACSVL